jgi:hypothetical protein
VIEQELSFTALALKRRIYFAFAVKRARLPRHAKAHRRLDRRLTNST